MNKKSRLLVILPLFIFVASATAYFYSDITPTTEAKIDSPTTRIEDPATTQSQKPTPAVVVETKALEEEVKVVKAKPARRAKRQAASEEVAEKKAEPTIQKHVEPKPKPMPSPTKLPKLETLESAKLLRNDSEFWVWGGIGENYQRYEQTIPSISGSAKFQNIQGPTLYLSAGFQGDKMGLEFSHKETPGKMTSSSVVEVEDGDYKWKTLSGELLYKFEDSPYRLRGGIQYQIMPFMQLDAGNSTLTVRSNSVALGTLGFDKTFRISKKVRGEWLMRYQIPISSGTSNGDKFDVSSSFAFDGSVGGIYQFDGSLRLGLFWYGQWHQYNFKYESLSGGNSFSGKQSLFYSNIELRLGMEF